MNERKQIAAEKLGAQFATCSHCGLKYLFDPSEVFSVNCKGVTGDYDDGTGQSFLCCSHRCASRRLTALRGSGGDGIIWRSGRCGGTLISHEDDP
jgi:hypothetical protein